MGTGQPRGFSALIPPETALSPVPYTKSRVVRRFAQYSGWVPPALVACERAIREQKPEALLTSGPPHHVHWLGLWLKRRHGLPWVADFRDPWFPTGTVNPRMTFASRWVPRPGNRGFQHGRPRDRQHPRRLPGSRRGSSSVSVEVHELDQRLRPRVVRNPPLARISGPPRIVHTGADLPGAATRGRSSTP